MTVYGQTDSGIHFVMHVDRSGDHFCGRDGCGVVVGGDDFFCPPCLAWLQGVTAVDPLVHHA